jgi:hypothetical protein
MRRPTNIILSMIAPPVGPVLVKILRSNEATWRRPT